MWETYGLENEEVLWAGVNFLGGIGGRQEAVCGAISAASVSLGLRQRQGLENSEKADAARDESRRKAGELLDSFRDEFGNIVCRELTGADLSDPEVRQKFRESGEWDEKCKNYVRFVIEKLYEIEGE